MVVNTPGAETAPVTDQQPQTPSAKVPWSPAAAIVYAAAVYFVAQFAASLLLVVYPHLRGWGKVRAENWLTNVVTAQFWYVLFAEVLTFGAIWWFLRRRGSGLRTIGWRRPRLVDIAFTLSGFLVYFIAFAVLLSLAQHLFPSLNTNQKQELGFNNPVGTVNLILTFISLVVLPPLAEETVFRGFVFTGLRARFKFVWSLLITSALFAVAHLEFGSGKPLLWVAAIDTFTLSVVLCYLREKTRSLWPGILLHALKNCIAFISLYLLHAH